MKTPIFLSLFAFVFGLARFAAEAENKPNLVIILTDDQGYADVGFNGCEDIPTPNIDRIAREGVRFTSGYVTHPVCSPSRAGLMTGRYQGRFGYHRNPTLNPFDPDAGLPLEEENMAEILKKVGYHSGIIGKWHLGTHPRFRPNARGFNEFYGFVAGGHRYFPEDLIYPDIESVDRRGGWYNTKLLRNEKRIETDEYLTDELSNEAVDFVARNQTKPFFLYLSYNAPHTPMQAPRKYLDRFDHIADRLRKTYAAMVSAVDDGVGRLLQKIDELGLAEKTLIFFLSDNGGAKNNGSNNFPLRDFKGQVYEGGIRVPFAVRWTGKIPSGMDYDHPVSSMDILATMVGLTGVKIDPDRPLDGVDLLPYLTGKKKAEGERLKVEKGPPHEFLFWLNFDNEKKAVRRGSDKLVVLAEENERELYRLSNDIGETRNRIDSTADTPKLEKALDAWTASLEEPRFDPLGTWNP